MNRPIDPGKRPRGALGGSSRRPGSLGSLGESNVPPDAATFYWPHRCEGTPQTHLTPLGDPYDAPAAGMVRHARVFDAERSKDGPLMLSERLAEPLHETSFAVFVKT
jgi:hypothetical protein